MTARGFAPRFEWWLPKDCLLVRQKNEQTRAAFGGVVRRPRACVQAKMPALGRCQIGSLIRADTPGGSVTVTVAAARLPSAPLYRAALPQLTCRPFRCFNRDERLPLVERALCLCTLRPVFTTFGSSIHSSIRLAVCRLSRRGDGGRRECCWAALGPLGMGGVS
jgi:hypothetical protein